MEKLKKIDCPMLELEQYKKLTIGEIEDAMKEYRKDNPNTFRHPIHYSGPGYSYWDFGGLITGDGGKILYDEAMKKAAEVYLEKFGEAYNK
jgi:hypothetical protein